jgi:RND family efflux transporter MFP subunit
LSGVAIAIGVSALAACGRSAPEAEEVRPVGVAVAAARVDTIRDIASASGVVVTSAAGDWTIYASEAAQVAELPKKEGDVVAVGDLLVRFEIASANQELAARELALADATARVERAKSEFARLSALYDRGIAPRNTFEAARSEQANAESLRGQAATQLELSRADASRSIIRARFPGVVAKIWRTEGELVRGGSVDPIVQVIDTTRLQVAVELPVAQLARIIPGQVAMVRAIGGDATLPATVALKLATTDPTAPTGQVRLAFTDPATLAIDAPVSAEIVIDQRTDALIVPADAVKRDDLSSYVVVAGTDRRAHRRDVRTGLITKDVVQVVSGLAAGERVVLGGLTDLVEGAMISFVE